MGKVCVASELVVTEIEAVKAPLKSKLPAPLDAVPMPKCLAPQVVDRRRTSGHTDNAVKVVRSE
jgi:hypothetical protein